MGKATDYSIWPAINTPKCVGLTLWLRGKDYLEVEESALKH